MHNPNPTPHKCDILGVDNMWGVELGEKNIPRTSHAWNTEHVKHGKGTVREGNSHQMQTKTHVG